MNIILIIADTLRTDHLGCYGSGSIRTPHLDWLAARSVLFDNHYAGSFPTMPARADFFTGEWSFTHMGWEPLPEEKVVLAEHLSRTGYRTAAVVDTPFYLRRGMNYDRGFDFFLTRAGQDQHRAEGIHLRRTWHTETDRYVAWTTLTAAEWLEQNYQDRFFLLVDTWDPHEPWDPPDWYVRIYDSRYDGSGHVRPPYGYWQQSGLTEADLARARACYAGEVTMVDRWIGYLLEMIEYMNLMDDTAIVFTTDHGFYFGEHGGLFGKMIRAREDDGSVGEDFWDRSPLYEEVIHIPLLIYLPGRTPGISTALTSAVDIMPSVMDIAGLQVPNTVHGRSLSQSIEGEEGAGHEVVVSSAPLPAPGEITRVVDDATRRLANVLMTTITMPPWSLLYSVAGEPSELYNLADDPHQEVNLIDENRTVAEGIHARYYELLRDCHVAPRYLAPRATL